jgi:PPP family 3-phenylpropionic acid transporter
MLWSESVGAEVLVFVLLGPWLLSLLGRTGALALAAGAAVVRWGVMAQTADVTAVALVEPLHGLTFALFHLGCMRIIADTVPTSLAGMAQAVYGTFGIGGATALSTILLGNGCSMLPSVSHHLELAHCAFTRFQPLEAWVI